MNHWIVFKCVCYKCNTRAEENLLCFTLFVLWHAPVNGWRLKSILLTLVVLNKVNNSEDVKLGGK